MKQTNSTFTYQSQPRAVAPQRRKYRDERAQGQARPLYGNIMHDPRVIRGNTYRQDKYPSVSVRPVGETVCAGCLPADTALLAAVSVAVGAEACHHTVFSKETR